MLAYWYDLANECVLLMAVYRILPLLVRELVAVVVATGHKNDVSNTLFTWWNKDEANIFSMHVQLCMACALSLLHVSSCKWGITVLQITLSSFLSVNYGNIFTTIINWYKPIRCLALCYFAVNVTNTISLILLDFFVFRRIWPKQMDDSHLIQAKLKGSDRCLCISSCEMSNIFQS